MQTPQILQTDLASLPQARLSTIPAPTSRLSQPSDKLSFQTRKEPHVVLHDQHRVSDPTEQPYGF